MRIPKRQSKIRRAPIAIAIIFTILAATGAAFYVNNKSDDTPVKTEETRQAQSVETTTTTLAAVSETPSKLVIDKIGVDAAVEPVGLTDSGAMDAPKTNEGVGWYDKSARAGGSEFAVLLDGHYGTAKDKGVFYRLAELAVGDEITLFGENGARLLYKIVETGTFALEDVDMRKALYPYRTGAQSLTIITCEGTYDQGRATYDKRSVVYAERVE